MALASGHWIDKEIAGVPPSPRYGHAIIVVGNIAFLFGGASNVSTEEYFPLYLNDFYMITVSANRVTWEQMPQKGDVPTARAGHSLCVVKGKLYLFGGSSHPEAKECLAGVYCFDIVTMTWEKLPTAGVSLRTLKHSSAALGENIYVYGGIQDGVPTDDLMMFNTMSLHWMPIKTTGALPSERYNHSLAVVGEQIFLFGGCSEDGSPIKDIYALNTESLVWEQSKVKGDSPVVCAGQTFTSHHDKDIYLFGGTVSNPDGAESSANEIYKLSIAKMKWKVPLYVGIPPVRRHGHTAFIVHSHLYVFGGRNEEQEFNDLKIMKLINPSERQPVMKEILSEFGLQGLSNSFTPTKIPNVKYELSQSPVTVKNYTNEHIQVTAHRDFTAVRDEAMSMIHKAFAMLDEEFQKLDREKAALARDTEVLRNERDSHNEHLLKQKQELQDVLEKHKAQNEAWLRARADENDKERKELCKLREEVLHEQERLKEEQCNIQKRSEQLLSIMQQFKGM
ncbi:rab9 effector protein with kelch motifs isoform X3 [Triplophysa rosa]|nr:rab9 effector protein with kelch motifs isoform X3 [Triplophysa rosa]XP_057176409.1 rab9 effector protein with kelch motifs isoform X3 [Triplophysa rosa]XP_057176410.1 rab9 effector protein with kelch motifs isoform X3 [Triplophysa rosa]XP_057176411.1 rab9 effector protein with kelch motifs isoform X3 [Triplophysa rosa]XP_057176413.1 rab9 effector protein with kelch motifs isoform X3 [Triplophysa rosa]